jgi:PAS domain S-box-containing protein
MEKSMNNYSVNFEKIGKAILGRPDSPPAYIEKNGKLLFVNQRFCLETGYTEKELLSDDFELFSLFLNQNRNTIEERINTQTEKKLPSRSYHIYLKDKNGIEKSFILLSSLLDEDNTDIVIGILQPKYSHYDIFRDFSDMYEEMSRKEDDFKRILDNSSNGIVLTDVERIHYFNSKFATFLGYKPKELAKHIQTRNFHTSVIEKILSRFENSDEKKADIKISIKSGLKKNFEVSLIPDVKFNKKNLQMLNFVDITERGLSSYFKTRDPETNLRNYEGLKNLMREHIATISGLQFALINIQILDENDILYSEDIPKRSFHSKISDLMTVIALDLKLRLYSNDIIARRAGHAEFMIYIQSVNNRENIHRVLDKIMSYFPAKHDTFFQGHINAVAGITQSSDYENIRDLDPEIILKNATQARIQAQNDCDQKFVFFNSEANKDISSYIRTKQELQRQQFFFGDFEMYVQGIYDVNMNIVGVERLMRWHNDEIDEEFRNPEKFWSIIAEQSDMLENFTKRQMEDLFHNCYISLHSLPKITTNILVKQITPEFLAMLELLTTSQKIDRNKIVFEILEREALTNSQMDLLGEMHSLGFRFILDDFGDAAGRGLNAFLELSHILSGIKVSKDTTRRLINSLHTEDQSWTFFYRQFVNVVRGRNLNCIAEGIESEDDMRTMIDLGFNEFQGFLF